VITGEKEKKIVNDMKIIATEKKKLNKNVETGEYQKW
jgi:hypothetical protein